MQGWRLVFYVLAGLAGMTTALLLIFGLEPRTAKRKAKLSDFTGLELRGHKSTNSHASFFKQVYSSITVSPLLEYRHCISPDSSLDMWRRDTALTSGSRHWLLALLQLYIKF